MPAPTEQWRVTLGRLWETQSQYSQAADTHKTTQRRMYGPLTVMGFAGVVISTTSPYLVAHLAGPPAQWGAMHLVLTLLGPLLVTLAAVMSREVLGPKEEQKWIKARQISEALKAEGYIFAVGAPPYSDEKAPELLAAKIAEIVGTPSEALQAPKPDERRPREPIDVGQYITVRVKEQKEAFYDKKARENARSLGNWRLVTIALTLVSAGLGVVAGVEKYVDINVWIAVVSTALATVTAYVGTNRFEFLAASYAATSQRLGNLVTQWEALKDPAPAVRDRFILDCEATLSAQNRTWVTELSKSVSDALKN